MYLRIFANHGSVFQSRPTSIFLPIPGLPDYEASITTGQVRNASTGYVLKATLRRSSCRYYVTCSVGRIHRLIMATTIGRPLLASELVLHADGNSMNNDPENLRIGSAAENARDKIATNTNGRSLRNAQVREIRQLSARLSRKLIAAQFHVSVGHVGAILTGRRWSNLR